jgi:hypothetical protein
MPPWFGWKNWDSRATHECRVMINACLTHVQAAGRVTQAACRVTLALFLVVGLLSVRPSELFEPDGAWTESTADIPIASVPCAAPYA